MNKFVYLAGPIAGCDEGEIQDWRKYAQSGFMENIIGINPYRAESESESPESKKRVVMKNYMDIKSCDLILACLPKHINDRRHSYGTTGEIAWGYSLQKPIVIVSDDEQVHNHPLLFTAGAHFIDLYDAIDYINVLLGEYNGHVSNSKVLH